VGLVDCPRLPETKPDRESKKAAQDLLGQNKEVTGGVYPQRLVHLQNSSAGSHQGKCTRYRAYNSLSQSTFAISASAPLGVSHLGSSCLKFIFSLGTPDQAARFLELPEDEESQ
jgi:hypothetical protein